MATVTKRIGNWGKWTNILMLVTLLSSVVALFPSVTHAAPPHGCEITSPADGTVVTGPVTIAGTYTNAWWVTIHFDGGLIHRVHEQPTRDDKGTWTYTWDPAGHFGDVEVRVWCFSNNDRYRREGGPVTLNVAIPSQEPPAVSILSPPEGSTAGGVTPIVAAASDTQGLASVEVRVDWGTWETASLSSGNYVYDWDATGLGDKTHAIEARATDTDGNVTKTSTVYVKTGAGTSELPEVKIADRTLYVWEPETLQLLENPGARNTLAQFTDDPSLSAHPIRTLYIYADVYEDGRYPLIEEPEVYRSLIQWAHAQGYYVHGIVASAYYAAPLLVLPQHQAKAIEKVENILNYNISSAGDEQFDGIQVDIENDSVPTDYLDMLAKMMHRKSASGQNINLGPATRRQWYMTAPFRNITWQGKRAWLGRHVQELMDYTALMDYRDAASKLIAHATPWIDSGDELGKPVVLLIETDVVSWFGDPSLITFHEEGRDYMEGQLNQVYTEFGGRPSFYGMGIHHYAAYRQLPDYWGGSYWEPSLTDTQAPSAPTGVTASMFDWQQIDLRWENSTDDGLVSYYEVHRGTTSGFTPNAQTLARVSTLFDNSAIKAPFTRMNTTWVHDYGLLPIITYYYKIIAVDAAGNKSAPSEEVSATTAVGVGRMPLRIEQITFTRDRGKVTARIKVVDAMTGEPVQGVRISYHWENAADEYGILMTGRTGEATSSRELSDPTRATFVPERLLEGNYYWAYSLDAVHYGVYTSSQE